MSLLISACKAAKILFDDRVPMFSTRDLATDFRAVFRSVPQGDYVRVTGRHGGKSFRVFQISVWNEEVDGNLTGVLDLTSRQFKDRTVTFLNVSRYLMLSLKVSAAGGKYYLIEPRPGAQGLIAARLGLTVEEYEKLVIRGGLNDLVRHDVEKLRRKFSRRDKGRVSEIVAVLAENRRMEHKIASCLGQVSRTADDYGTRCHQLAEAEAEIRIWREEFEKHGLPVPTFRPRTPWNPRTRSPNKS